jgi:CubicO group peptidase (beta-lactamase class C family)
MVERANNTDLETYMKKHIFTPLGHTDFAFFIEAHPSLHRRLVPMTLRAGGELPGFGTAANPDGALSALPSPFWPEGQSDCAGGAGGYASAPAYQAVLHSLARNDGALLSPAMNDELFRPQLSDAQIAVVAAAMQLEPVRAIMAPGLPAGTKLDYALGGMISMEDVEGQRRKGAMHWGGLPNLAWWCDREAGVSGFLAHQLLPTGDKRCAEMFGEFERAVYESVGKVE